MKNNGTTSVPVLYEFNGKEWIEKGPIAKKTLYISLGC